MDILLCILHCCMKVQITHISDQLIRMPPVRKQKILMDKRHSPVRFLDLLQAHIEINPMELLMGEDIRTQLRHIRLLLYIPLDQAIHIGCSAVRVILLPPIFFSISASALQ